MSQKDHKYTPRCNVLTAFQDQNHHIGCRQKGQNHHQICAQRITCQHKPKLKCFRYLHQWEIYQGKVGVGYRFGSCQIDKTGIEQVGNHSGVKLPGSAVRPWNNAAWCARVDNATRRQYHKTPWGGGGRCVHQVNVWKLNLWCTLIKYWWILFVVILKETCINQDNFPSAQRGKQFIVN